LKKVDTKKIYLSRVTK